MQKKFEKYWSSEYFEEYQLHSFLHHACRSYVFSESDRTEGLERLKQRYLKYMQEAPPVIGTCFTDMLQKHGRDPRMRDEFLEYALDNPVDDDDPLRWWKDETRFPTLAAMARDHLGIQASSAASERAFSKAKLVITDHRTRMKVDTVRMLMCVESWLWFKIFAYQYCNKFCRVGIPNL